MSQFVERKGLENKARLVRPPLAGQSADLAPAEAGMPDRNFGLPPVLHFATVGLFLTFLTVMAAAFGDADTAIPLAICLIIVIASFAVPALWSRISALSGDTGGVAVQDWHSFMRDGVETLNGRLSGRDATVQVLILPAVICAWGMIAAGIALTL